MIEIISLFCTRPAIRLSLHIKQWTKPVTPALVAGILADTKRSRADLVAENAVLRHQLIVLRRQVKRPELTPADRTRLVLLARCTRFWLQALHIVQADTRKLETRMS
jgi:putative transposase